MYIYPIVKLLLSFAKIINLLGGIVFYYGTTMGTCKCTSRVHDLEALRQDALAAAT